MNNNGLYFIVGALVVIVGVLSFVYFGSAGYSPSVDTSPSSSHTSVNVKAPSGSTISGSVRQSSD